MLPRFIKPALSGGRQCVCGKACWPACPWGARPLLSSGLRAKRVTPSWVGGCQRGSGTSSLSPSSGCDHCHPSTDTGLQHVPTHPGQLPGGTSWARGRAGSRGPETPGSSPCLSHSHLKGRCGSTGATERPWGTEVPREEVLAPGRPTAPLRGGGCLQGLGRAWAWGPAAEGGCPGPAGMQRGPGQCLFWSAASLPGRVCTHAHVHTLTLEKVLF